MPRGGWLSSGLGAEGVGSGPWIGLMRWQDRLRLAREAARKSFILADRSMLG